MRTSNVADALFRYRIGRSLGLAAVLAGMSCYRSFANRVVLGRWSPLFAAAIAAVAALLIASVISGVLSSPREQAVDVPWRTVFFDLGMLTWGIAYLWSALDDPNSGGRLLDLNLTGSIAAGPALLEWTALVMVVLSFLVWMHRRFMVSHPGLVLSCASVSLTLLFLEGASRVWTLGSASPHMGYATRIWYRRHVIRNSAGQRDVEHALAHPANVRRLLVVGDSYAFGWGLPSIDGRFGEQLARHLAAGGERWESINFSEPDKHTLQESELLRTGLRYQPDLVILVYVFNDMDYLAPITPRTLVTEAPKDLWARVHPVRVVYENSYAFQEAYARVDAFTTMLRMRAHPMPSPYDDSVLVQRHLRDLARIAEMVNNSGAAFAIVPIDLAPSVDTTALRRYDHFVRAASAAGLPVISIAHAFDGRPLSSITVSSLDGHPNALGHRIAVEASLPQISSLWRAFEQRRPSRSTLLAGGSR